MLKLLFLLSLALPLAQAAETTIYTGFNYGAFWGSVGNAKTATDFKAGFGYAHDLKSAMPFNSARLFTCKQQGTNDEYSQAFDAAVETKTNLLLGMWISPAKRGDPLDNLIKTELSALGKGFEKHGQALGDLVIGLSVGSEDIFRWEDDKENVGVAAKDVTAAIKKVKDTIASSAFAKYMANKPIGHVDTAKHSVVDGADFYGITVYPYWNKDPVANAKGSFKGTLDNVVSRANGKPIWIAEVGWPFQGASQGASQANAQSLQQFWSDVGCSIIGKYTTFWFELIKDSESNQPDWAECFSTASKQLAYDPITFFSTVIRSVIHGAVGSAIFAFNPAQGGFLTPPFLATKSMIPWCLTMADVASNGQLLPVAGGPAGKDGKCTPPPPNTAAPSSSVLPKDVPCANLYWLAIFIWKAWKNSSTSACAISNFSFTRICIFEWQCFCRTIKPSGSTSSYAIQGSSSCAEITEYNTTGLSDGFG
ncbi:hypothetical protein SNOG_12883 [Parastagonospora nodorum SN15]|uniref:glucan endo-1,3-beta-D-glucosidase n=1 Tax=Phaeosphaeria nodorum (strain SN15 / ATCC MYA-4574 / FGSC 10173) TaxID=321614 RepID=Q0U5T1_PHANO|nr:hypothetical protein SNOG_12883 [Parastagonospora nodorum SN15]EAT79683.2 hypothetical protein SNOG_12883 [Parastagonospora nodorum SN15]